MVKWEGRRGSCALSLRKWAKLFGISIAIGGIVSLAVGIVMAYLDPDFAIPKADDWIYNMFTFLFSGLTLGAFAHMGFFAYLTLNYIALSIFKKPYLWIAFQGFVTLFVLVEVAINLYGTSFPPMTYWALPVLLVLASLAVSWRKVRETTKSAWVPSLFFMIVVTVLEGNPAFRSGSISSLVYMMLPLFACNTYQILQLHRILEAKSPLPDAAKAG